MTCPIANLHNYNPDSIIYRKPMAGDHTDGSDTRPSTGASGRPTVDRRRFLTATGAGATAGLAGCLGGGDDETITLGAVYLLSSVGEQLGASSRAAVEVAVEEINENGGIMGRVVAVVPEEGLDVPAHDAAVLVNFLDGDLGGRTRRGTELFCDAR